MLAKTINMLLVEDNQGDIDLTKEALSENKLNIDLNIVRDGEEALDFLYKRGKFSESPVPNIIILDLNLPKIDGREVLKNIKQNDDLRRIPVVILTSSKDEEDIIKSYDMHANCYITKPLNFDSFVKIIKEIDKFWLCVVELPDKQI